jgi:hypothetical protein
VRVPDANLFQETGDMLRRIWKSIDSGQRQYAKCRTKRPVPERLYVHLVQLRASVARTHIALQEIRSHRTQLFVVHFWRPIREEVLRIERERVCVCVWCGVLCACVREGCVCMYCVARVYVCVVCVAYLWQRV